MLIGLRTACRFGTDKTHYQWLWLCAPVLLECDKDASQFCSVGCTPELTSGRELSLVFMTLPSVQALVGAQVPRGGQEGKEVAIGLQCPPCSLAPKNNELCGRIWQAL
eukprot:1160296-Pelagomonas_calceolata.AAC.3